MSAMERNIATWSSNTWTTRSSGCSRTAVASSSAEALCATPTRYAKGLVFVHQCWIAHMDLSMANLLLSRDECLKICDRGCSSPAAGVLSFPSEHISTEYVRAPEVWLGGSHAGPPCDL